MAHHAPGENYLNTPAGLKSWLMTLDHKRIGIMYLFGILIALIVGGVFALLVRTELFARQDDRDGRHVQPVLHAARRGDGVPRIIPGIPAALGNIIMPIQLGAPDVAFPRLNLAVVLLWVSARCCSSSRSRSAASTPAGRSTRRTRSSRRRRVSSP